MRKNRESGTISSILFLSLSFLTIAFSQSALAATVRVSMNPGVIQSGGSAIVSATLSAPCPDVGGCNVTIYSSQTSLVLVPLPSHLLIPQGALTASAAVKAGQNPLSYTFSFSLGVLLSGYTTYSSTVWVKQPLVGPYLTSMTTNLINYIFPGQTLSITMKVSEPCPAVGCAIQLYNARSSIIKMPTTFTIPAGQTQGTLSVIVSNVDYLPIGVSFDATFNTKNFRSTIDVYAPLGEVSADGSFKIKALGSAYRDGIANPTAADNDQMARRNMNFHLRGNVYRQCRTINPNGELVALASATRVGEYRNISGMLTYDYSQNLMCTSSVTSGMIKSMATSINPVKVGVPFTLTTCLISPIATDAVISLQTTNGSGLPLPATMTIPAEATCGVITLKATSAPQYGYTTQIRGTLKNIMFDLWNVTINP